VITNTIRYVKGLTKLISMKI